MSKENIELQHQWGVLHTNLPLLRCFDSLRSPAGIAQPPGDSPERPCTAAWSHSAEEPIQFIQSLRRYDTSYVTICLTWGETLLRQISMCRSSPGTVSWCLPLSSPEAWPLLSVLPERRCAVLSSLSARENMLMAPSDNSTDRDTSCNILYFKSEYFPLWSIRLVVHSFEGYLNIPVYFFLTWKIWHYLLSVSEILTTDKSPSFPSFACSNFPKCVLLILCDDFTPGSLTLTLTWTLLCFPPQECLLAAFWRCGRYEKATVSESRLQTEG